MHDQAWLYVVFKNSSATLYIPGSSNIWYWHPKEVNDLEIQGGIIVSLIGSMNSGKATQPLPSKPRMVVAVKRVLRGGHVECKEFHKFGKLAAYQNNFPKRGHVSPLFLPCFDYLNV